MSNKLVKLTPEQKKQQEDEQYMRGKPTRMEVSNFVNSVMEEHYIPLLTNQMRLSAMVLQAILIDKDICTGEEIEEITKEFVKKQEEEMKKAVENQKDTK